LAAASAKAMKRLRVLFVASANNKYEDVVPFIRVQGDSLAMVEVDVEYHPIHGKGFIGYASNLRALRRRIQSGRYDVIHAHFVLMAWLVKLAAPTAPLVLSLMGTDAYGRIESQEGATWSSRYLTWLTYAIQPFVRAIISKSANIESFVYAKRKSHIIPNGVDMERFQHFPEGFRAELGLPTEDLLVLFMGNPADKRKNIALVNAAMERVRIPGRRVHLVAPYPVSHDKVIQYLNSANVLVLASYEEGSPNIVKEAMACNLPVVSTNVGDVKELFLDCPGYSMVGFDADEMAEAIRQTLLAPNTLSGRNRLIALRLRIEDVALRVRKVYEKAMNQP
jgi:teichuronic acid biosynthesis glycosyltransferase TuaC